MPTIIVASIIGIWFIYCIAKMVKNVKDGKSIDGCNGDCSSCGSGCSCENSRKLKEFREAKKCSK